MRILTAVCAALVLWSGAPSSMPATAAPQAIDVVQSTSCGEGYYRNSAGRCVRRPTRTPDDRPPAGATARCRDGTYSFSQSRRGTCSRHGGVSHWL